jgi:hypothetical protein
MSIKVSMNNKLAVACLMTVVLWGGPGVNNAWAGGHGAIHARRLTKKTAVMIQFFIWAVTLIFSLNLSGCTDAEPDQSTALLAFFAGDTQPCRHGQ